MLHARRGRLVLRLAGAIALGIILAYVILYLL